ncbi:MAG: hypothetical protein AABY22_36255 [Nanoarchaeota archaeon]
MIIEFEKGDLVIYDEGRAYEKRGVVIDFTPNKQKVWILATDGIKYKIQMRDLKPAANCKISFHIQGKKKIK